MNGHNAIGCIKIFCSQSESRNVIKLIVALKQNWAISIRGIKTSLYVLHLMVKLYSNLEARHVFHNLQKTIKKFNKDKSCSNFYIKQLKTNNYNII